MNRKGYGNNKYIEMKYPTKKEYVRIQLPLHSGPEGHVFLFSFIPNIYKIGPRTQNAHIGP